MGTIAASVRIDASPEEVFAYLADIARHGEWTDNEVVIEQVSEGEVRVGTRFRSTGRMMGRDWPMDLEVTAYEPPSRLAFTTISDEERYEHELLVRPADGGSVVERRNTPTLQPIAFRILGPIVNPLVAGPSMRRSLRNLKARLEGGAT